MRRGRKLGRGLEDFSHLFLSPNAVEAVSSPIARNVENVREGEAAPAPVICIAGDRKVRECALLTLSLALEMAEHGKRVLLVDADYSHPRLWMLMDGAPHASILGLISANGSEPSVPESPNGVRMITLDVDVSGLGCLGGSKRASLAKWFRSAEEEADILLVAASATLSRHTLAVLRASTDIVVVTPQHVNDRVDAYGVIKTVTQVNGNARVGIVSCRIDAPDRAAAVFGKMQRIVHRFLGKPLHNYGYIPQDTHMTPAMARRAPLSPSTQTARCITDISQCVLRISSRAPEEHPAEGSRCSLAERLFGSTS